MVTAIEKCVESIRRDDSRQKFLPQHLIQSHRRHGFLSAALEN
jgi:hypothetical protein